MRISVERVVYIVSGFGCEYRPAWFEDSIFDDEEEAEKFAQEANRKALDQYLNENPNRTEDDYYNRVDTFSAIVEIVEPINSHCFGG